MRLYSLTNMYLSPIQNGIQTAHAVHDIFVKYSGAAFFSDRRAFPLTTLVEWASNHKTIIVLNGGNSAMLENAYERIQRLGQKLDLPYVKFHEDEQSLNNALTCVAIVVPERVYSMNIEEAINDPMYTREEIQLRELLSEFRLA